MERDLVQRLGTMNDATAERTSSIAATFGLVAAIFGLIVLLLVVACLWYVNAVAAQITSGVQQALASPEFQEQMVVFMVFYVVAYALVVAWNHFESLFDAPDAMEQAAATVATLFNDSMSTY